MIARARFAAWVARLRVELARKRMRLAVDAPDGAGFDDPPLIKVRWTPEGGGTLSLRFGTGVHLGRGTALEVTAGADAELAIADHTAFGQGARVQLRGGRVAIGEWAQVRDHALLKSDGELLLGERVVVGHSSVLSCTQRIAVDDLCGLGERVTLIDSDHGVDGSDRFYLDQPLRVAPVHLARNVLVSAGAVILRGTSIGPNAVVAANAVVTGGEQPGGWLIGGVPAKPLRALGPPA